MTVHVDNLIKAAKESAKRHQKAITAARETAQAIAAQRKDDPAQQWGGYQQSGTDAGGQR